MRSPVIDYVAVKPPLGCHSRAPASTSSFDEFQLTATAPTQASGRRARNSDGGRVARQAILRLFCEPAVGDIECLARLSDREWRKLLVWLDISGLALYFLDRITELNLENRIPVSVLAQLRQRMAENVQRTRAMIDESVAIQAAFQEAGLSYATLKGLSLFPLSVPRPVLRHQCDLDFLISEDHLHAGRKILEQRGYRLYAVSGKSWEFKKNETPCVSMKDMYRDLPGRAVELHVESRTDSMRSRLDRSEIRQLDGFPMRVLSPVDLFICQGQHAFKDVCSAFSRTAHLLEFYRHVLARRDDESFWRQLEESVGQDRKTSLGLGVVIYLLSLVMGDFAPQALTDWTVAALPTKVKLWVDIYGEEMPFRDLPGTKLYLLLQRELELAGIPARRTIADVLLPKRLPPVVVHARPNEPLRIRFCRYRLQLWYIFSRLFFHVVEGRRYVWESLRWQQRTRQGSR